MSHFFDERVAAITASGICEYDATSFGQFYPEMIAPILYSNEAWCTASVHHHFQVSSEIFNQIQAPKPFFDIWAMCRKALSCFKMKSAVEQLFIQDVSVLGLNDFRKRWNCDFSDRYLRFQFESLFFFFESSFRLTFTIYGNIYKYGRKLHHGIKTLKAVT